MTDMYGNGVVAVQRNIVPNVLVYFFGETPCPQSGKKQAQNIVFFRRQRYGFAVHGHFFWKRRSVLCAADECFGFNVSSSEAEISAQMRAHAGADFDGIERLCYVVVRADVETKSYRCLRFRRGEKNHGNIAYLPDFGKGGHTVLDGHHYVHKNKVYVFPFDNAQSLFAVACGIEFI